MKLGFRMMLKRALIFMIAACLIVPQFALAAETNVPSWQFTDMSSHWAKKHVSKIALLGFASGMGDGTFAPNNSITQQDAIILVVRMMGLADKVDSGTEVVLPFVVSDYAKPYVVLALSEKLISMQEELTGTTGGEPGSAAWGTRPAKREWIAKLIVRAIGKQAEADAAMQQPTGFVDESSIGDGYRGYINVAKSLGIVSGTPEGTFNPANTVTRAEMAVFLGNAEKHLAKRPENLVSGEVISFNGATLSLVNDFGSTVTYSVSPDAGLYEQNSNNPISAARIGSGDYVNVIVYGNVAYYVELTDPLEQMKVIEGVVSSVSTLNRLILLEIDGSTEAFTVAENVVVHSASGSGMSFSAIPEGSTVQLRQKADDPQGEVVQIVVKAVPVYRTLEGTVESIGLGTRVVEIRDAETGVKDAFVIPSTLAIQREGETVELADLHVGDEVIVELKDNIVTAFTVTKSSITYVDGRINYVNTKDKLIYLIGADNNRPIGYYTNSNPEVEIGGLGSAGLEDLLPDDLVTLHLDKNEMVVKVVVKSRSVEAKLGMEFSSYDNGWVILKHPNGRPELFELAEDAELLSNGNPISRSNLTTYFTPGKRVDITYTGERLLSMSLTNQYTGVVTEINTNTRTIKLNSPQYGNISLTYNTIPIVEIFGIPSATINHIQPGDEVQALLDADQERVMHLKLVQTQLFKVVGKQSNKLIVSTENIAMDGTSSGTTYDLFVYGMVPITHHANRNATVNDIPLGGFIQASLAGSSATSVYVPEVSVGRVSAVNAAASAVTVSRYGTGSGSRTIANITNLRVSDGGATYSLIDTVRVDDRVAAVEGKDGFVWIIKLQPQSRTFLAYSPTQKSVEFAKRTLNENNKYTLADNAYLHRGTQTLTMSAFTRNDAVTVYMWEGQIVEMEKK